MIIELDLTEPRPSRSGKTDENMKTVKDFPDAWQRLRRNEIVPGEVFQTTRYGGVRARFVGNPTGINSFGLPSAFKIEQERGTRQ